MKQVREYLQTSSRKAPDTLRVGLVGFGKTGRAVANILFQSTEVNLCWVLRQSERLSHRSVGEYFGIEGEDEAEILSVQEYRANDLLEQRPVDVIVDFSGVDGIGYYGDAAAAQGVAIITAISQYPENTHTILQALAQRTRVIYSPNITLGINFLLIAGKILKNIAPDTDIEIIEEHFRTKPETSGTARVIAKELELDSENIKSIRAGGIIGTHEILFGFPYQNVRLKHESISREAFGNGVLFAINNLPAKRTGLYTMEDLLIPYFNLHLPTHVAPEGKKPWWKIW